MVLSGSIFEASFETSKFFVYSTPDNSDNFRAISISVILPCSSIYIALCECGSEDIFSISEGISIPLKASADISMKTLSV